jgi:putative ABC transport system permease protein
VKTVLAWRILAHEKSRGLLAIMGIFTAVLLIFLQLGFYYSVPKGGMLLYDHMRFDIMLTSKAYVFQAQSQSFPRRRLYQALADPDILRAVPVYQDVAPWLNEADGVQREVFVLGLDLEQPTFSVPSVENQLALLRRPDTILVDSSTRPVYGSIRPGREVEIANREVRIVGNYDLGTGFVGLGVAIVSEPQFLRLFPERRLSGVNLGLLSVKPGADVDKVTARLQKAMPEDVQVYTYAALTDHEVAHWVIRTSTGIVFGFGVIVACIVGMVILYQTLATQILRYLPQYAVLKAMGYTNLYLGDVVLRVAGLMSVIAFVPASLCAVATYAIIQSATLLPIEMTLSRLVSVFAITLFMSASSALLSIRVVRRADPVELL